MGMGVVSFGAVLVLFPAKNHKHVHFLQPVKKKHRARVIEYFIDVARECFNIGNFNSLMAIICKYASSDMLSLFQPG